MPTISLRKRKENARKKNRNTSLIYHDFITIFGLFGMVSFLSPVSFLCGPMAKVAIVPDILLLATAVVYGMNSVSCVVGTAFSLVAAFFPRRYGGLAGVARSGLVLKIIRKILPHQEVKCLAVRRAVRDTMELQAGSTR